MPDNYYVRVNTFNGSATGHANITIIGPNGSYTYGTTLTAAIGAFETSMTHS